MNMQSRKLLLEVALTTLAQRSRQTTAGSYLFTDLNSAQTVSPQVRRGATGRALEQRSTGRGFKSYLGQQLRNNLGQVVHIHVPLSPSSIT